MWSSGWSIIIKPILKLCTSGLSWACAFSITGTSVVDDQNDVCLFFLKIYIVGDWSMNQFFYCFDHLLFNSQSVWTSFNQSNLNQTRTNNQTKSGILRLVKFWTLHHLLMSWNHISKTCQYNRGYTYLNTCLTNPF